MKGYQSYQLSGKERLLGIAITLLLAGLVSWLFYQSPWGMVSAAALSVPVQRALRDSLLRKQKSEMLFQFKEMLQMASAAIKAG